MTSGWEVSTKDIGSLWSCQEEGCKNASTYFIDLNDLLLIEWLVKVMQVCIDLDA